MISLGHRTGLFDAMSNLPPADAATIAGVARLNERYVREWLGAMTVGCIVTHDPVARTYHLPPEHAALLTRAAAPNNIAGVDVTAGLTKGSTELTVTDASSFSVGDVVLIDQIDDDDKVKTGDCQFFKRSNGGYRSLGQIFEIVSKSGNRLEISSIELDPSYTTATATVRSIQRVRPYRGGKPSGRAVKLDERADVELRRLGASDRFVVWKVRVLG